MSTVELFAIDKKGSLTDQEQVRVGSLREKLSMAKSLRLEAQVRALETDIASIERSTLISAPPLTADELTIWRAWLPTAYVEDTSSSQSLSRYQFDRIPKHVLQMWKRYKDADLFERFEIWTPEIQALDPVLVGVNGEVRHLLARWGESDANLLSFEDIKGELVRRWHQGIRLGNEPWSEELARMNRFFKAFLFSLITSIVWMFSLFVLYLISVEMGVDFSVADWQTILLLGVCLASGPLWYRWRTKRLFERSALMQAILRHQSVERELLPAPTT